MLKNLASNLYIMDKYYLSSTVSPFQKLRMVLVAVVLIVLIGTVGLVSLEDMSYLEALYMTVITLSTVGFGEIKELHDDSRVFVIFLIVFGVMIGGYLVTIIGQLTFEGQFKEIVARRKMRKNIKKMTGHYIIAGFGRVGRQVAREFVRKKVPFVIIEKETDEISKILAAGYNFVEGDATDEDILHHVGIDVADTLISTLPDEAHNVYLTLTARDMNPKLKIIARADFEEGEKKLIRAGADHVVIPHILGGMRMAFATLRPHVVDFMQIASVGEEGLSLEEIVIPKDSRLHGKSLLESNLKKDYGVTIVGIKPADGKMRLNPEPNKILNQGDILVLIGQFEHLERLNKDMKI